METDEVAQPEEGSKTSAAPRTKKPTMEVYVPKKRQTEKTDPQEKPHTADDKKSRPRPRYTDKARKSKKDKAKAVENQNGEVKQGNGGTKEGDEENLNENNEDHTDIPSETVNTNNDDPKTAEDEEIPKEEEEEENTADNWDSLFNDDGDCLDPNLLEEVKSTNTKPH